MKNLTLKYTLIPFWTVGLLLTACQAQHVVAEKSLFSDKVVRLGDTVVATVDGTSIYLSDVEHAAQAKGLIMPGASLTPKDPLFQSTLDELIDQRLLALEALRRSLDQDNETRRRLAMARERILADVVVNDALSKTITDEAVKRMYEEQKSLQSKGQQMRARKLVVADEKQAQEIKKLIEQGGDFADLVRTYSLDRSTRDLGGDMGWFAKDAVDSQTAKIVSALEKNQVSEPVKTSQGWAIFKRTGTRDIPNPGFEALKPKIVKLMTYEEIQKLLKSLRTTAQIDLKTAHANATHANTSPKTEPKP